MRTLTPCLLAFSLIWSCTSESDPGPSGNGYTYDPTPFAATPAIEDIVLYEVNLRAFSNNGSIQGVIDRLDYLEDMGVNVIWLMPIYPVGQVNSINSPYCIRDYKDIGVEYGDLDDLRRLTTKAHEKGMAVMLDWVANHTAWDHPWITAHPDWYTQDGNGDIVHPPGTNWQDVADLNFDNSAMRAEMIASMKYWVEEANVDGFRCDYADGVPFDFWSQAIDTLRALPNRDLIFFAEGERADHFAADFDLSFGWSFYSAVKNVFNGQAATVLQSSHNHEYNNTPVGHHWVRFTTNHDESAWDATPMTLFNGRDGALAASVVTVFTGGVPLIYGSQEVGRTPTLPFFSNDPINWSSYPFMREAYERMLTFYAEHPASRAGATSIHTTADVFCIQRLRNNDEILILANVRNSAETFDVPADIQGTWVDNADGDPYTLGAQLSLQPYQYLILSK